jgi:hypothetical protein
VRVSQQVAKPRRQHHCGGRWFTYEAPGRKLEAPGARRAKGGRGQDTVGLTDSGPVGC